MSEKNLNSYNFPRRGDVYYVSSKQTSYTGSEQRSDRHAVIVSNNYENRKSNTVQIVYITTQNKLYCHNNVDISLPANEKYPPLHREAICNQVMTVDKSRLNGRHGRLSPEQMTEIEYAIANNLGLKIINRKDDRYYA